MTRLSGLRDTLALLAAAAGSQIRIRFATAILLVAGSGAIAALAPLALQRLVDTLAASQAGSSAGNGRRTLFFAMAYLLALGAGRSLNELRPLLVGGAEQRLYAEITIRFSDHLVSLPLAFHLQHPSGKLTYSLQQAIVGCQLLVAHLTGSVVSAAVEMVTVAIVLSHLHQPAVVMAFFVTSAAYLLAYANGVGKLRERSRAVSSATQQTYAQLGDNLLNVDTIKCYTTEAFAKEQLASAARTLGTRWVALHLARARMGLVVSAIFLLSVATSLTLTTQSVMQGTLTIGAFVMTSLYMVQMVRPIETLGNAARDIAHALEFVRPALDILRLPAEARRCDSGSPVAPPLCMGSQSPISASGNLAFKETRPGPALTFRRVSFGHDPQRPVLQDLDLEIQAGSKVGIVGLSGSGKSTLVRLLLRLHEPDAGCIFLDNTPIGEMGLNDLRRAVALVPQDIMLFHESLAFNIGVGRLGATQADIQAAARVAHLHELIQRLPKGYDTLVGERGAKLSGGERQRVAIARAVLKRPQVYVFDEATSMLDSHTETIVLQNLQRITAGCTTLTIAHRLATVAQHDEIVVIAGGCVVERGRHALLLARGGAYARLWKQQVCGDQDRRSTDKQSDLAATTERHMSAWPRRRV